MSALRSALVALRRGPRRPEHGSLADLFAAAAVAMVPLTMALHAVLPPRFSYDSGALQRIAQGDYNPLEDTSYLYVGRLYGYLGMADRPWAAAALGILLAAVALHPALVRGRGVATLPAYALVGLYVLTSSVYLGQYSKDVWVLPVVLVVLLARPGLVGELGIVAAVAAYASLFREYWFLILVVYLALRLVTLTATRRRRVLGSVVAVVAGTTLLAPAVLGTDIQGIRDGVNLDRVLSSDAATAISSPEYGLGMVGDIIENVVTLVELALPVPLLLQGSPVYAMYFAGILLVWAMFARSVFMGPGRVLDGDRASRADIRTLRAALFAVAVLTTQGFFEPDYGSYLRHLTPVLPLVIAAVVGRPGSLFLARTDGPAEVREREGIPQPVP